MLLLVLGTGAAVGLHLGFLHLYIWNSKIAGPTVFFLGALCFSFVTYVLWRWVFPRLPGDTFGAQIAVQIAVSLLAYGVLSTVVVSIGAYVLGAPALFGAPTGPEHHITITAADRQGGVRFYALLPIVPSVLSTIVTYHLVWLRMQTLQTRARELGELAATAQLAALRAQINPHFLFNSLNSIAQLIHVDPAKAEACVERLAEIFRYLLNRAEQDFVPLSEELQMTNAYLEIERARFDDRLRVETTVDPNALRQLIPNLVLQPLVENAIKHGVSAQPGSGRVEISARRENGMLVLRVRDDGPGLVDAPPRPGGSGVGLANTRERLQQLYGDDQRLELENAPEGGLEVTVGLPFSVPATATA
jgi:two-component sensor histidine kinase